MIDFWMALGPRAWLNELRAAASGAPEPGSFRLELPGGRSVAGGFERIAGSGEGGSIEGDGLHGFWVGDVDTIAESLAIRSEEEIADALRRRIREEGFDSFDRTRGPLALCVWDETTGRLHALRDKMGMIPVRFLERDGKIAVSNNGDLLHRIAGEPPPRLRRVRELLTSRDSGGREGYFEDVYRVFPREHLSWRPDGGSQASRYWSPSTRPRRDLERLRDEAVQAFRERFQSFDPAETAVSMSGGVDSMFLAALLADCRDGPDDAVTASMVCRESRQFDERHEIVEIGRSLPVEHHLFDVSEHWPLKRLELFRNHSGEGPPVHPMVDYETRFHRWAQERLGIERLLLGTGAEYCFGFFGDDAVRKNLFERGDLSFVREETSEERWQTLKEGLKYSLRRLPGGRDALEAYRSAKRWTGRRPSWTEVETWLRFEPPAFDWFSEWFRGETPGEVKLRWLDGIWWEQSVRLWRFYRRTTPIQFVRPYLDEAIFELGLRVPWRETLRKQFLREMAATLSSAQVAFQESPQRMSTMTVKSLARKRYEWIRERFQPSLLDRHYDLVSDGAFRQELARLRDTVSEGGLDAAGATFGLWLTTATEVWLETLESQ